MQPYHHIVAGFKLCTEKGNFAHWTLSNCSISPSFEEAHTVTAVILKICVSKQPDHVWITRDPDKQLNAISKEKPNFWTMKQEKGSLIQYSTVNSQICLITGSWSNLVNEKPSITIPFFAKPAPGISGWFYCLGHGISERHGSSLDPRATWPCPLMQHLSLEGLHTAVPVSAQSLLHHSPGTK